MMAIPELEVQAQMRPEEETYHFLLLRSECRYFLHVDGAGFLEAPALSSGVAGDENLNEVT
jgi:hypothetical protein